MNADWAAVYRIDRAFPPDIVHNGHSYVKASKRDSLALQLASDRIKRNADSSKEAVHMAGMRQVVRVGALRYAPQSRAQAD